MFWTTFSTDNERNGDQTIGVGLSLLPRSVENILSGEVDRLNWILHFFRRVCLCRHHHSEKFSPDSWLGEQDRNEVPDSTGVSNFACRGISG